MRGFEINQGTGKNLRTIISKELVKSPVVAVKELVSNSYDADAETVIIETDEANHTLLVEDDGFGMREGDLEKFLRMGDSEKIGKPKTPKGRDCIGQFGIATVLLQYLGDSYDLETWKGNTHITGTEIFSEDNGLEYVVRRDLSKRHGTRILIRDVKALGTDIFSIRGLKRALTWEVPNDEDLQEGDGFSIVLNGEKLVRKNTKPQQEFEFEETLETAGKVHMHLEYFGSRPQIGGVYVYVNGRSVGDPGDFNLHRVGRSLSGRVFAKITVDGLKKYISFDRDHFKEDNIAFGEVKKWVYSNLHKVKRSLGTKTSKSKSIKDPTTDTVRQTFESAGFLVSEPFSNGGEDKKPRLQSRSKQTQGSIALAGLYTVKEGLMSPQARLDFQTRELIFNVSHPWYQSSETVDKEVMKMHVLLGGCYSLAEGFYLETGGSQEYVTNFNTLCGRLLSQESVLENVRLRALQGSENERFVSFKKYDVGEVLERMDVSLSTLRKLVAAEVLHPSSNKIKGSELNDCMHKMANYTPASTVMEEFGRERGVTRQRIDQLSGRINETLTPYTDTLPFLYNIGISEPFFLIPNEQVPIFKGLYAQGAIKRAHNVDLHVKQYQHLFERAVGSEHEAEFIGLEGLCNIARGTPSEVFKIVSFSQRRGVEMPFRVENDEVQYSLSHFKKAREKYLSNGEK